MNSEPLDQIPLWCLFPLVFIVGMMAIEIGYRFGRWGHKNLKDEKDTPVAAMVAAILGLLGFMLAFTFGLAATRFDARRQAVFEEANAIGTTYLRARLVPEPYQSEIEKLLRQYTEIRVQFIAEHRVEELISKSEMLHEQIWSQAVAAAEKNPGSIATGLFLQSLNETIDLHSKRVFVGLRSRIPTSIWIVLFSLTLLGMSSVGYQAGLAATRRSPEMPILMLAFTCVLFLIVDLDRAHEGMLQVNQQSTADLLRNMQPVKP